MALKKFSQFSTKTSLTDSDYTVGYNGSTNYKWTLINLYNYIKSKLDSVYLKLTGGELSGGLEFSNSLGTAVRSYTNVVSYYLPSYQTGAIVITHPIGIDGPMTAIKVIGYDLEANKNPFEMTLGGYQSSWGNWLRVKAIGDNVYFDRVRVGYNASAGNCVIILGDVNTKWYYTLFSISLIAAYGNYTGLTSGWNVELVTDLSPYTKIVDVPLFLNGVNYTGTQLTASGNSVSINYSDGISYAEVECGGVVGTLNVTVNNVQIGSKIKLTLYDTDNITALNLTVNALLPSGTTTACNKIVENWQVGGGDHVVSIDGYYMVGSVYRVFVNLKPF